jgi:hypothetical protein
MGGEPEPQSRYQTLLGQELEGFHLVVLEIERSAGVEDESDDAVVAGSGVFGYAEVTVDMHRPNIRAGGDKNPEGVRGPFCGPVSALCAAGNPGFAKSNRAEVRAGEPGDVRREEHIEGPVECHPGFAEGRRKLEQVVTPPEEPAQHPRDWNSEHSANGVAVPKGDEFAFGRVRKRGDGSSGFDHIEMAPEIAPLAKGELSGWG